MIWLKLCSSAATSSGPGRRRVTHSMYRGMSGTARARRHKSCCSTDGGTTVPAARRGIASTVAAFRRNAPRTYLSSRARLASDRCAESVIVSSPTWICVSPLAAWSIKRGQHVTWSDKRPRRPRLSRQTSGQGSRVRSGMRRRRDWNTICPSSRARGAPKQKWLAHPNAR